MTSDAEREPVQGTPRRKDVRPERRETRRRIRRIVERHRETFDELAK